MTPLPGDASTRRYFRLADGSRRALLMDQPQGAETPTAPPGASAEARRALGYNAVARLAGADVGRFAEVARYLKSRGLSAPEIYAADTAGGFLIMEDLGDGLFADVVTADNEAALYNNAVEVLARLHAEAAPAAIGGKLLFAYDDVALLAEIDQLTEWYLPQVLGRTATADEIAEYRALWQTALGGITASPPVFVHRDYHAQNLIWLPQRQGVGRTGLIDFQDAVAGARAYDLVSLLEDARRDVAPAVAKARTAALSRRHADARHAPGRSRARRRDGGDGRPAQRQDCRHLRPPASPRRQAALSFAAAAGLGPSDQRPGAPIPRPLAGMV